MNKYINDNFEYCNTKGKVGEDRFNDYLCYLRRDILDKPLGYQPGYDFRFINALGIPTSAEIKTCYMASDNVPIEYESRGRHSGINATESEHFIVYSEVDDILYISKASELLDWLEAYPDGYTSKDNNSNSSETKIHLIKKSIWKVEFQAVSLQYVPKLARVD